VGGIFFTELPENNHRSQLLVSKKKTHSFLNRNSGSYHVFEDHFLTSFLGACWVPERLYLSLSFLTCVLGIVRVSHRVVIGGRKWDTG
jgi:hypothetical protein